MFVDTHLFIGTPEGLWPGLPLEVLREMKPTSLVLVKATAEEIMARRALDGTRSRDRLTVESLEAELGLGRSFLAAASAINRRADARAD